MAVKKLVYNGISHIPNIENLENPVPSILNEIELSSLSSIYKYIELI